MIKKRNKRAVQRIYLLIQFFFIGVFFLFLLSCGVKGVPQPPDEPTYILKKDPLMGGPAFFSPSPSPSPPTSLKKNSDKLDKSDKEEKTQRKGF